jgi:small GTP-binding protein
LIQKKIALLGAAGVGKTSLVRRCVSSLFDEAYLTTIGVKVDKKQVSVGGTDLTLMLWDVAGAEENASMPSSYVRGASGYLLVADGTRPETLDRGRDIVAQMNGDLGPLPHVVCLNKSDLAGQWRISDADAASLARDGIPVIRTSALSGAGVEDAFMQLAAALVRS